jgi:YD repeat-containing protein
MSAATIARDEVPMRQATMRLAVTAALSFLVAPRGVLAAPAAVQNVRFGPSKQALAWDAAASAAAYNVYRGTVSGLPNNATCLIASTPSLAATVTQVPAAGIVDFYLVSGIDGAGDEGPVGTGAAVACVNVRRALPLTTNGPAADGVFDGEEPRRNANAHVWSSRREDVGVYLHTGEAWLESTDLVVPGRGMDFRFTRKYRSQIDYAGPLGYGWDFTANARLAPLGSDVLYHDGTGRRERFLRVDSTHFTSPTGLYGLLKENGDGSFVLRWPDGKLDRFHALDLTNVQGALESVENRSGDTMRFLYSAQGLLTTVVDTLGRSIAFAYGANGRLTSVTDFSGRAWVYTYDVNGNLASVRSPLVSGTPNGNDFPSGKTTSYTYSSGQADARLNHNLLTVKAPNEATAGSARIINVYGTSGVPLDRVTSETIGGTNASGVAAGGSLTFAYLQLNGGTPENLVTPRRQATVTDRNGNIDVYTHNFDGNLLTHLDQTNRGVRASEGDYTTTYSYNADGEIVETVFPEGNRLQLTYDVPGLDRYREGDVKQERRIAGTRGDGRGSAASDIVVELRYEPLYNRLASMTEPRGNDPSYVPRNGGAQSAARYRTAYTYDYQEGNPTTNGVNAYAASFGIDLTGAVLSQGDRNEDGRTDQIKGNLIRTEAPPVRLDTEFPNQLAIEGDSSQESVTLSQWNDFGQTTVQIDAERNRSTFAYYHENDPDGDGALSPAPADGRTLSATTGGYLATRTGDTASESARDNKANPTPASIQEDDRYDLVGHLTHAVDGRGVLTRRIFNALDQVVELRRAAATADNAGPLGDASTGRGEIGLTALALRTRSSYDANDNLFLMSIEDVGQTRGVGTYVDTTYAYDILDRKIESSQEATPTTDLVTQLGYDANENVDEVIHPEGNRDTMTYDERDLLYQKTRGASGPRGGTPSTVSFDYDGSGSVKRFVDGRSHATTLVYDGFDRRVRTVDPLGNAAEQCWDPASNLVRRVERAPGGGPSACTSTSANDLSQTDYLYDERNEQFGDDRRLFVSSSPVNPAVVAEGLLRAADGFVNRRFEHDKLDRRTFVVEDSGATMRDDYDGASRKIKTTLADSQSTVESTWDDGNDRIEVAETEASSSVGPPAELFLTTSFYDALGRRELEVDNLGQTNGWFYDSLDAVVVKTDPRGPAGGTINRRSAGHEGLTVAINGYGNVTRYAYDGAGRRTTVERVLTASGAGDGTLSPASDTSNMFNADGLVRRTTTWDDNGLVASEEDDRGNVTSYAHDNLDRRIQRTMDDGTTTQYQYDMNDNVTQVTDANGSVLVHTYDDADRKTQTSITRGAGVVGTTLQTFQYDGIDRLTQATDNNSPAVTTDDVTVSLFHDSLSRLVEERQQIGSDPTLSTDHQWLASDLQSRLVYPAGRAIDYTYDGAERLVSVADAARPETATFEYFGLGRLHSILRNNGVTTTTLNDAGSADIGYDGARRVVELRHLDATDAVLADFRYSYDRASRLASERRGHNPLGPNLKGELYGHDSSGRLSSFREGPVNSSLVGVGTAEDEQTWLLDGMSNWPQMVRNGTTYTATPNNLNQYDENQPANDDGALDDFLDSQATPAADGRNHDYDENGNLSENADASTVDVLRYDAFNRLVEVDRDAQAVGRYTYSALGHRVRRVVTNRGALNRTVRYLYAADVPAITMNTIDDLPRPERISDAGYFYLSRNGSWHSSMPGNTAEERPSASSVGNSRAHVIEERDATSAVVRQSVVTPQHASTLWQIRNGGTSAEHLLLDRRGSAIAVTPANDDIIAERLTYDAYGTPTFENAANQKLCEGPNPQPCGMLTGPFLAESTVGNPELFRGLRYDPELGKRTKVPNTDYAGLYSDGDQCVDPNEGRSISYAGDGALGDLGYDIGWDAIEWECDPIPLVCRIDTGMDTSPSGLLTGSLDADGALPALDWGCCYVERRGRCDVQCIGIGGSSRGMTDPAGSSGTPAK